MTPDALTDRADDWLDAHPRTFAALAVLTVIAATALGCLLMVAVIWNA